MTGIRIGVKGRIISKGRYAGWHLLIEQEGDIYYLYLASDDDPKKGYDNWLPDYDSLVVTMEAWGITEIEWLDD